MKAYPFYLLCSLMMNVVSSAQTLGVDTLKSKLHRVTEKSERLNILLALGSEQYSLNRDSAYEFAAEAMALAQDADHREKTLAALYFSQSYVAWGWIDSALAALEPVLASNPVTDSATRDLYFLLNRQKAMLYGIHTQYKEALEILYRLIHDAERYKDSISLGSNLNTIGSIAIARGQPQEALRWLYKALSFSTIDHRYDPVNAAIYINLANASLQLKRNDSALFYLHKAVPLAESVQNLYLLNTALRVQTAALVETKQLKEAEQSFRKMQAVKAKTEVRNIVEDNLAAIDFYISTGQVQKAIEVCEQNLRYTSNDQADGGITFTSLPSMRLAYYEALAKCYKLLNREDEYLQTLEQIIPLKDSAYREDAAKEIADIQTRYETQLRENKIIQQQQQDITRKNYLFYSLLILSLIAAAIALWIFVQYRRRQEMQSLEAIKKAEENERVRIAADLHDNLGAYAASMVSNLNYLRIDETNENVKNAFSELKNNSGAMIAELNDTIWVLKKENLSLTAISDRLKVFIGRLRRSYPNMNIDVEERLSHDPVLSSSQAFNLYRIMQEAVNNALKHSGGTSITVVIAGTGDSWKVSVTDNGKGMPGPASLKENNGLGNMRARGAENGWAIQWLPVAMGGTHVEIFPTAK
jgi:signal transduction histidine kinase